MRSFTLAGAIAAAALVACGAQAAPKPAAKPAPAAAHKLADRYALNGSVKIHYVVEGKGPLVVLVHGYPLDGHSWENWRDRLRDGLSYVFPGPRKYVYE